MENTTEFDQEWDEENNTYILYEHTTEHTTVEHGTDTTNDESYEQTEPNTHTTTAYYQIEFMHSENTDTPNHLPTHYVQQLVEQGRELYQEYDIDTETKAFDVTMNNENEIVVIRFRQFD